MAISRDGVARARIIWLFERDQFGDRRDGSGHAPETRLLPWAFIRFDGDAEENYVMPHNGMPFTERSTDQTVGTEDAQGNRAFARQYMEFMPNRAFPLESSGAASVNSNRDDGVPGPVALHYFGGV